MVKSRLALGSPGWLVGWLLQLWLCYQVSVSLRDTLAAQLILLSCALVKLKKMKLNILGALFLLPFHAGGLLLNWFSIKTQAKFSTAALWSRIGCLWGRVWTRNEVNQTSTSPSALWPALRAGSATLFIWTPGRIVFWEKGENFTGASQQVEDSAQKVRFKKTHF